MADFRDILAFCDVFDVGFAGAHGPLITDNVGIKM
jgi:hypothetical protein